MSPVERDHRSQPFVGFQGSGLAFRIRAIATYPRHRVSLPDLELVVADRHARFGAYTTNPWAFGETAQLGTRSTDGGFRRKSGRGYRSNGCSPHAQDVRMGSQVGGTYRKEERGRIEDFPEEANHIPGMYLT